MVVINFLNIKVILKYFTNKVILNYDDVVNNIPVTTKAKSKIVLTYL